ncbi:MAG: MBL fold metallo-hydrolase [Alphaproteobacteria bacterium]|nr:MBL fold metallo-hydrolase [Alphaproteobacteria bacterium]MBE8220807.1 MBL fold metallo-hydrolase [Alphaproteobacteria bacterium]
MSEQVHILQAAGAHGLRYPFEGIPAAAEAMEVAPDIYWVRMSLPYDLDHINLYLLRDGDGWAVIDSCVDRPDSRKDWSGLLAGVMEGRPINKVIITHLHPDHVGLAGWLVNQFDAEFYMSRTDYLMCRMLAADTGQEAPKEALRFYKAAGFNDDSLARYKKRFGGFGQYIHALPQSYQRLQQDDSLTIGGRTWRVEIGRGHAPEHACLYCEELGVLIAGDQVIPRISSNVSVFPTEPMANPLQDWIDSCARLRDCLPPETLVLPSHNEPFYGLHERLSSLIEKHEKSLVRLLDVCDVPRRATDREVFSCLFKRKIGADNYFMATGEALAHLICLVHRGDVAMSYDEEGVCYYTRTSNDKG